MDARNTPDTMSMTRSGRLAAFHNADGSFIYTPVKRADMDAESQRFFVSDSYAWLLVNERVVPHPENDLYDRYHYDFIEIIPGVNDDLHVQWWRSPEAIRVLRRRSKLTQGEFADLLEVSLDTVKSWELGRRKPGQLAIKVANASLARLGANNGNHQS